MLSIIEAKNELIDESRVYCAEHGSPSVYLLQVGGVLIPMCNTCIEELKRELEEI